MTALHVSVTVRRIFSVGPAATPPDSGGDASAAVPFPPPLSDVWVERYSWRPRLYHNLIFPNPRDLDKFIISGIRHLSIQTVIFAEIWFPHEKSGNHTFDSSRFARRSMRRQPQNTASITSALSVRKQ